MEKVQNTHPEDFDYLPENEDIKKANKEKYAKNKKWDKVCKIKEALAQTKTELSRDGQRCLNCFVSHANTGPGMPCTHHTAQPQAVMLMGRVHYIFPMLPRSSTNPSTAKQDRFDQTAVESSPSNWMPRRKSQFPNDQHCGMCKVIYKYV